MRKIVFRSWCSRATSGIRTSPERENVSQELFDHLEDLYLTLTDSGMDPSEALAHALESMGDAEELSSMLAAVHRPFWGHVETVLRRTLAVLTLILVFSFGLFYIENYWLDPILQKFDPDAGLLLSGEVQQTMVLDPDSHAYSDGYTITVDRASVWQRVYDSAAGTSTQNYLNVQIRVSNPRPWAQVPDFSGWYWAEDSQGNYYYSACEDSSENECSIHAKDYRTGFFTCVQDLWFSPYISQDAQWIELHYDRAGRNIVLHIALTER